MTEPRRRALRAAGGWAGRGVVSAVGLCLTLALAGCATGGSGGSGGGGGWEGKLLPDLTVKTLKGARLSLASLRGKVVLLDVWASWCEPCKQELPMLDDMAGRLKSHGVEILAVSVDDDRANVDTFLASRQSWRLTLAHDPQKGIADTLQPEKMPSSYVIDREGVIRHENRGFEPQDAPRIEAQLQELAK